MGRNRGVWMGVLVLGALPGELRAALGARHTLAEDWPGAEAAGFAVAVTTSIAGADAATLARVPALRLPCCNGVGLDRIDMEGAARRGITVRHTPNAVRIDTAEAAVALSYATVTREARGEMVATILAALDAAEAGS